MSEEDVNKSNVMVESVDLKQESVKNQDDGLDRKTLFVRSIPFEATSEELSEFFSQFVPVKHAVIVTDNEEKVEVLDLFHSL